MSTPLPLEVRLARSWPPDEWRDVTVLLAVSGGADSVALLRAIQRLKTEGQGRVVAAHYNHRLRGGGSEADQQFVADLCRQLAVPCEIGQPEPGELERNLGDGLEAAARSARYRFLQATATRLGARYVVTAHTADDQAETILHRIVRGTGIRGLAGIQRVRPLGPVSLIRPLLECRRAEILAYLEQLGQPYCVDSSNADVRYTRNRIRLQLLPDLAATYNPGMVEALLRLGRLAGEAQAVIDRVVDELYAQSVVSTSPRAVSISAARLLGIERYLVRQLLIAVWQRQQWPLQAMGYQQWDLLADMLLAGGDSRSAAPRRQVFPGEVMADIAGDVLHLSLPTA